MGHLQLKIKKMFPAEGEEAVVGAALKELEYLTHQVKNLCEHVGRKDVVCSISYCDGIHKIRDVGFNLFGPGFPLDDYDFNFLQPLAEAKRVCYGNCSLSRAYFRMAYGWLKSVVKSLY